ncbi:MAG: hypothetical protein IT267_01215 [Saprospiraceae bacterium]|nr:hypothetical protein [Saprospiraceae bacterium]
MKNKILSLLLLITLNVFMSCGKDDTNSDPGFSCKIDGTGFNASGLLAYGVNFSSYYAIYGITTGGVSLYFSLNEPKTTGTFDISKDQVEAFYTLASGKSFNSVLNNSAGSVTINSISNTNAQGSFNFVLYDDTGKNPVTISEGKFNVTFR